MIIGGSSVGITLPKSNMIPDSGFVKFISEKNVSYYLSKCKHIDFSYI